MADKMLFMVAAMAAEMERDLIRERTLDGLLPPRAPQDPRDPRGALMLGMFLAALDQTIVATALPTIAGDLADGIDTDSRHSPARPVQKATLATVQSV